MLMVKKQAKLVWRDAAPPGGTVLSVPGGVPHRGKGRTVPPGGRFSTVPRSSRGVAKEGGHLLPRRHPPQALSGSIVEKHLDPLESLLADLSEGRLLGVKSADQAIGVLVRPSLPGVIGSGEENVNSRN